MLHSNQDVTHQDIIQLMNKLKEVQNELIRLHYITKRRECN